MTQCRARRRLVQPSSSPGSHPQLGPLLKYSEGPASALPTPLLLVYAELQRQRLGSNPHRVTITSDNSAGSSGRLFFHSRGAKQDLLSSLELLLSLPPRLDPMPTANSRAGAPRPPNPVAETTHLQLQGSHPENISKVTWRQQHAQRIHQCGSSSPRSQRELFQKYGQSESLARLPTF